LNEGHGVLNLIEKMSESHRGVGAGLHSVEAFIREGLGDVTRKARPGSVMTQPKPRATVRFARRGSWQGQTHGGLVAKDDLIQVNGSVQKILGGGRYEILIDSGQTVTAQLSGRMRRFRIRVIPGDRVQVGLSPYDPTHGFITFRLKEGQDEPS